MSPGKGGGGGRGNEGRRRQTRSANKNPRGGLLCGMLFANREGSASLGIGLQTGV